MYCGKPSKTRPLLVSLRGASRLALTVFQVLVFQKNLQRAVPPMFELLDSGEKGTFFAKRLVDALARKERRLQISLIFCFAALLFEIAQGFSEDIAIGTMPNRWVKTFRFVLVVNHLRKRRIPTRQLWERSDG